MYHNLHRLFYTFEKVQKNINIMLGHTFSGFWFIGKTTEKLNSVKKRAGLNYLLLFILSICIIGAKSQDKIYFLDGTTKTGKVTDIGSEYILINVLDQTQSIPASSVLLIEFLDGHFEQINSPDKGIRINKDENFHFKQDKSVLNNYNLVSLNSLALCNADVAAFYERVLFKQKVGLGLMGAYNFNSSASLTNIFIIPLTDSKKNYDVGAFINFYIKGFERKKIIYFGLMLKYTSFNYTQVNITNQKGLPQSSNIVSYKPAADYQLASMITFGRDRYFENNFFIKTLFGIGSFKLSSDYRNQYNLMTSTVNNYYLPKIYLGINLGYKL